MRPIEAAAAVAAASARGDLARARELAAELGAPPSAASDGAALVRALVSLLHEQGERVPDAVAELARRAGADVPAMADLARELAHSDRHAGVRVPMWLPVSLGILTFAAMGAALYVGRHSLGFIDPPPKCETPAGAQVSSIRFDDTCHVLSWQTESFATWIVQRDADGTPVRATRSSSQSIRELVLAPDGSIIATGIPPAELATLTAELAPMLRTP